MRQLSSAHIITSRLLVLLLCMPAVRSRAAPADSMQYFHYGIENGLPSNNVYNCIQDHLGYMWFATDGGAVKFNGYDMTTFNTSSGLPFDDVFFLVEDEKGRIFPLNLTNHFGYIKDDRYTEIGGARGLPGRVYTNDFIHLDGLFCILCNNIATGHELLVGDSQVNFRFRPRPADSIDGLWLSRNGFLFYRKKNGPDIIRVNLRKPFDPATHFSARSHSVFEKHFGNTDKSTQLENVDYAFSRGGKLLGKFYYDENRMIIHNISEFGAADSEYSYILHIIDKSDKVVLMTNTAVYVLDTDLNLQYREQLPALLTKSSQTSYWFKDANGNSWYCTDAKGIWYKLANKLVIDQKDYPELLYAGRFVGNIERSYAYWWNNEKHTLFQVDAAGKVATFDIEGAGRLESICRWNDSTVFVSFQVQSFFLDIYTGRKTPGAEFIKNNFPVAEIPASLAGDLASAKSVQSYKNRKLFYLGNAILCSIAAENGRSVKKISTLGECDHLIYNAKLDRFIAYGLEKIAVINPETDSVTEFFPARAGVAGKINTVCTDSFANVYILTTEGFFCYAAGTGRLHRLHLPFNLSKAAVAVSGNTVAVAGSFGIAAARVSGAGRTGDFYMAVNIRDHFYRRAIDLWMRGGNTLAVRADKGWVEVNTDSLFRYGVNVARSNAGRFSLVVNAPYYRSLTTGDTLQVAPGTEKLALDVVNLYGNGAQLYRYAIGDGNEWQATNSGEIILGDLDAEQYTTLKIRLSDANWQSDTITLQLYSIPRWWQRHNWVVIFWVSGVVLLALLVLLTVYITSKILQRADEKKRMLTDLELRAIHAQINPHFIFNTLSTALYFISRKEYENAYGHVNKFSHLLRSYLKSSHDRYVLLSEEIDMLKRYVDLQQTRFEEKFDFVLSVDNKIPANNIQIPSLLLQPLVENAINHGLFHRKEKGLLQLGFEQGDTGDYIVVTIDDNGVGRAESTRIKQESMADKESYGSKLTQKLMDIFRRYEAMDIEIQYIDKEAPHTGTIVKLTIGNIKYIV